VPGADAASPPRATPIAEASAQLCKLFVDEHATDPTANATQLRANVRAADLGVPVATDDTLYILFGDTIGFAGIWGDGESHPDAVGYALDPPAAIAAVPALLCDRLRIVTLPPERSIGPTVDARVEADFAGVAMIAPAGHALSEYIHNPAGGFANLPGDFEVPSGAFASSGAIYAFQTTVVSRADPTMIGSYVARWDAPSPSGIPAFHILGTVDRRGDPAAPLAGDFINVAAVPDGDTVYLFGTGAFRASPVHLARTRIADLADPAAYERFDAATGSWSPPAGRGTPIIATAGHGETSVRYFAAIDRWMFLAEELTPSSNRIVARFADRPEGPWSDAVSVLDMADPAFRARYCCAASGTCAGAQFLRCERTGFYAPYLFPEVAVDGNRFTVTYTLSSFDPYNTVLFQTSFVQP
jgi:hypothetical protein